MLKQYARKDNRKGIFSKGMNKEQRNFERKKKEKQPKWNTDNENENFFSADVNVS